MIQVVAILGAITILAAYASNQFGRLRATSLGYTIANAVGAGILTVDRRDREPVGLPPARGRLVRARRRCNRPDPPRAGARMSWPRDDAKLERVRALMAEQRPRRARRPRARQRRLPLELLADEGLRRGRLPARRRRRRWSRSSRQADDAARTAWTDDVRLFAGYHPDDPRPPVPRALEAAQAAVRERGYERIGLELSLGTQASDRMVGEPTTYTHDWFHAFGACRSTTPRRCSPRRARSRRAQEIERMRIANELAALAMEHVQRAPAARA